VAPLAGGMQAFAAMCSHVPNKGESHCNGSQIRHLPTSGGAIIVMFHKASGKKNQDGLIPYILEPG